MNELEELYQEMILDHNKNPRNFREMDDYTATAAGDNPLCGDRMSLYLKLADDRIDDISFTGSGCAIFKASASLMTDEVKGQSITDATALDALIRGMLTGQGDTTLDYAAIGKLAALSGINEFPMRVKCATLAWHTLRAGLEGADQPVTTE